MTITLGEIIEGGPAIKQLLGDKYAQVKNKFKKNASKKLRSLTLEELGEMLAVATVILGVLSSLPAVQNNPTLKGVLTTLTVSVATATVGITAYVNVLKVIDGIQKSTPAIKIAGLAIAMPPGSQAGAIAQETLILVQDAAKKAAKDAVIAAKEAALNYPIEIPIPGL